MRMADESAATPASLPDRQVVDRVLQGDGASFELIMRRHNRRLYRIARGIVRNEALGRLRRAVPLRPPTSRWMTPSTKRRRISWPN